MTDQHDYLMERRLRELDPQLHQRFTGTVFALQSILSKYLLLFPTFTDHTELHCASVIEFCNELIGQDQIRRMAADEIYVLLMACYLHDVGMGVSEGDYEQFKHRVGDEEYFRQHPGAKVTDFVRDFHHDFSGLFIEKYADLFDIPSPEHLFAIRQIARGHRRTDLFDEAEYPAAWKLPNGVTVCLPYLAALIRLADEIDVVDMRNPKLLYDMETLTEEIDILEFRKHDAVKALTVADDAFIMETDTEDPALLEALEKLRGKMQKTLDYSREVTQRRSSYVISQKQVILQKR